MASRKLRLIDAFCGAGGFTKGFLDTERFQVVLANDFDKYAISTYRANFDPEGKHSYLGDVECLLLDENVDIPEADVVIGGPPCQGFSLLNNKRTGDPRRGLWKPYLDLVVRSNANVFIMENVPQLLTSYEFMDLKEMAKELGFDHFEGRKLCAADYGVPQTRHRAVIIASRVGKIPFPEPTHFKPVIGKASSMLWNEDSNWVTVREAIGDLNKVSPIGVEISELPPPLNLHFGRSPTKMSLERYRAVPRGGNRFDLKKNRPDLTPKCWLNKPAGGTDLFGRLWWNRPSVTIRTEFFKPEKGRYLHPEKHRPITFREAARLQSFPDDFIFCGPKIAVAKQIGNAVPPLLASAIAGVIAQAIKNGTCRLVA